MKRWMVVVAVVSLVGCGASAEDMAGSVRKTQVDAKTVKQIDGVKVGVRKPGGGVASQDGGDPGGGECGSGQVPCGTGPCCNSATEICGDGKCHPRDESAKPGEVVGADAGGDGGGIR